MILGSLFFMGLILFCWMWWGEPRRFQLNKHSSFIRKKLPRPLRILHLTDTHFSGKFHPLSRFFDRLRNEVIDIVVLTGDIMDCPEGVPMCLENLKKLNPRYGIYAVFGNHDYYNYVRWDSFIHNFPGQAYPVIRHHIDYFKAELEKIGVKVLMNESVELDFEGTPILVHGLDDPTTGHANLRVTMENYDKDKVNLLLTHTVDAFLDIGQDEIDLSFSGHSHGGQVRLPFYGPIVTHTRMGRRYASGLFNIQGSVCCISRGLNSSRYMRLRFLCAPEAILLTIKGQEVF